MIRVLVAEDFGLLREDLCETLGQQEDMEVAGSAASGREIESLALSTRFDVVLMDIEMETTTAGIRAAERILEKKPEVKVIFLTAHETENMILTSMGAGAVDYIVKGCDEEELLRRIREAAAGHTVLDERVQNLLMKEYTRLRRSAACCFLSPPSPSSPPPSGSWCACCWRERRSGRSPPPAVWRWSP